MSKPILIDTHTHVNFNPYKDDGDEVIHRALKNGIWMINVGSQYSTSKRAVDYADKYKEGVYAAVGLHPSHIYNEKFDEAKYEELLKNEKVVALGEIGLDYGEDDMTEETKDKQRDIFLQQVDLARRMNKPVIFHCRKAYDDLIELLIMFSVGCAHCPHACAPGLRGMVHCFMGRWSQAEKLLEIGFYLSFNGLITYARDYDKVIEKMPLDRILLETDAPYLTPEPHRDRRNDPINLKYIAEKIAEIKKIKFKDVAKQTTKNARDLFRI
ncbi:TatD family hydrolase [Patescibacteria group bacterium]|nr:TatD family hydrolase [Patescibacteria group bacterium]MBU1563510.1 TatD family hydrolase [Patescibacteria group bacterium]MBU2068439.1 TatD family hydrolase [Patescibacteria group bacterium]